MSLLTQRQTEYITAGTFVVDVSDFSSITVIDRGTATITATHGVVDTGTFVVTTGTITSGTALDVQGFSHVQLVVAGTLDSSNKIILYGTINKIDRV